MLSSGLIHRRGTVFPDVFATFEPCGHTVQEAVDNLAISTHPWQGAGCALVWGKDVKTRSDRCGKVAAS